MNKGILTDKNELKKIKDKSNMTGTQYPEIITIEKIDYDNKTCTFKFIVDKNLTSITGNMYGGALGN